MHQSVHRVILALLCCASLGATAEEWRVGSFDDPLTAKPFQRILTEAYARVGLTPRFESLPLLRAEGQLRAGELDADLVRTRPSIAAMPFARLVHAPLRTVEYLGFRLPPCPARLDTTELAQLRVSLQRGHTALEAALPPGARVYAANPKESLRYVRGGMADLAALPVTPAMRTVVEQEGFCAVPVPLLVVPFFHLVHARHASWVPKLEDALREMERNGTLARIWADAEQDYSNWQIKPPRPASAGQP